MVAPLSGLLKDVTKSHHHNTYEQRYEASQPAH